MTDLGKALKMVADQLKMPPMTDRALPPVLVLLSDGQPTDDYSKGLRALLASPGARKRSASPSPSAADADTGVLQKFIDHPELRPLQAGNPEALVNHIKWASTAVLKSASSPSTANGAKSAPDAAQGGVSLAAAAAFRFRSRRRVW